MKNSIYFGVTFSADYPLRQEEQYHLAKYLFFNNKISASEAKSIIDNTKLIRTIDLFTNKLGFEIINIESTEKTFCKEKNEVENIDEEEFLKEIYAEKTNDWFNVFGGCPTTEEIEQHFFCTQNEDKQSYLQAIQNVKVQNLTRPLDIAAHLKRYIIGQDKAIDNLAVLLFHHKQCLKNDKKKIHSLAPLLIGNTGTGKSYLIRKCKDILKTSYIRINCGQLVPAGIVGLTVSKAMAELYKESDYELSKMEKAVVHFDEIDKLAKSNHRHHDFKNTIQFELINFMEDEGTIRFPVDHSQNHELIEIETKNMFFIFSGAFSGIENIILQRLLSEFEENPQLIDENNLLDYLTYNDIVEYGIIPELAGRLSNTIKLNNLTKKDFVSILRNSKDSVLLKNIKSCSDLGIDILITEDAIQYIASQAKKNKLGARNLEATINRIFSPIYFDPQKYIPQFQITKEFVLTEINNNKFIKLYREFERGVDLLKMAINYKIEIDDLLEIYFLWKQRNQ